MWIIIGNRTHSERIPNGKVAQHRCTACGEDAMFYERRVTSTMRLYFVDVFNYKRQRAMACGACGALYATDELGASAEDGEGESLQSGTIAGHFEEAAKTVGGAFRSLANDFLGRTHDDAPRESRRRDPEPERTHDDEPLDLRTSEERELDRRFAELEAKVREKRGEK